MKILLLLILAIAAAIIFTRAKGDEYARFRERAMEVPGKIVKKETRIDNPKTRHTENVLIYSYSVNGREFTGEERVEYEDLWMEARDGMPLRVYVDKNNAKKSFPAALIDRRIGIAERAR